MNYNIQVKENMQPIYDILFKTDFQGLNQLLEELNTSNRKICIVSDSNVSSLYLKEVQHILEQHSTLVETFVFPAGEENKNLSTVNQAYEHLIHCGFDRNDFLLALGGGVVGDLTGFVAATYLRGISFIQVPTSLLAMVDSSIGGKTGVDYLSYKNMIGAFHQPSAVYINTTVLETLSENQFYSGFGEVIKYGLIADLPYYQWLKSNVDSILQKDSVVLEEMIYRSCVNKQVVVENDPKEMGQRALLNFGHTLGHSIEKYMNFQLLHGDCVSIGMMAAAYISVMRGDLTEENLQDISNTLVTFHLPTTISSSNIPEIISGTKKDKKMNGSRIKFILLKNIGEALIDDNVTEEEMKQALEYITR